MIGVIGLGGHVNEAKGYSIQRNASTKLQVSQQRLTNRRVIGDEVEESDIHKAPQDADPGKLHAKGAGSLLDVAQDHVNLVVGVGRADAADRRLGVCDPGMRAAAQMMWFGGAIHGTLSSGATTYSTFNVAPTSPPNTDITSAEQIAM